MMITRARLRMSDLGERISSRKNAEVFLYGGDRVFKLYREHVSATQVERELRVSMRAHACALPTPALESTVFDVDNRRKGLMLEYVAATPCSELFQRRPEKIVAYSRLLAEAHHQLHQFAPIAGIPEQKAILSERLLHSGKISLKHRQQLLAILERSDGASRFCHGNFHPSNLLFAGDRFWVLSLGNASNGYPIADVARTSAVLSYPDSKSTGLTAWISKTYSRLRNRFYLREYLARNLELRAGFDDWFTIQLALRLENGIAKAEQSAVEKELHRILSSSRLSPISSDAT